MRTSVILLVGSIIIAVFAVNQYWSTHESPTLESAAATNKPGLDSKPDPVDTVADHEGRRPTAPIAASAPDRETSREAFARYLAARQYSKAIELYQNVYTRYDESVSGRLRSELFAHAAELEPIDLELAAKALSSYVMVFYRDVDALLRLAKIREQQQDYRQALLRLQEALVAAHVQADLEHIQSRINRVLGLLTQSLATTTDHNGLVSLYSTLIERQPNHAPYYLALAQAQVAAGSPQEALAALRYIQYDSQVGARAREMISRLGEIGRGSISGEKLSVVPLIPTGRHFVVSAQVNGVPVKLMIDTGASITVLKSDLAITAGIRVDHSHIVTLNTANGRARAPIAHLDQIQLGDQVIPQFKVVVLDLEELTGVDGLLGMDFLGRYRFTIDREHESLVLNR